VLASQLRPLITAPQAVTKARLEEMIQPERRSALEESAVRTAWRRPTRLLAIPSSARSAWPQAVIARATLVLPLCRPPAVTATREQASRKATEAFPQSPFCWMCAGSAPGIHDRRQPGSAGLGLAIVRRVADARMASITVENRDTGGASFSLRFQRAA
jgi:hypothetical protein